MIKYAKIPNYRSLGEVGLLSHLYQFVELDVPTPRTILVHAYEGDQTIFKGQIFMKSKTYTTDPMLDSELKIIEDTVGKVTEVDLLEFIKGTAVEDQLKDFTKTI